MKRKRVLSTSNGDVRVKITIELSANDHVPSFDFDKCSDYLTDGVSRAICEAPSTGARFHHQVKIGNK